MLNMTDLAAIDLYPELDRLIDLRARGWEFCLIRKERELDMVAGGYFWPQGWADAIGIKASDDAKAYRSDPAGGVVWLREGGLADVIDGLVVLPAPDEPGAPRLVKSTGSIPWSRSHWKPDRG